MTTYIASSRADFMNALKVNDKAYNESNQHNDKSDEGAKGGAKIGSTAKVIKEGNSQSKEGKTGCNKVHDKDSLE